MRIAVVSDTHDRVPSYLPGLLQKADAIWHLGDVCAEAVLERFRAIGPPLVVVRGNCDACYQWQVTIDLEECGKKIRLVHIPPSKAPPGFDLLLHGHTHVPRNELVGATRFLNPGCISRPNRGAPASYAWLTLEPDAPVKWEICRL